MQKNKNGFYWNGKKSKVARIGAVALLLIGVFAQSGANAFAIDETTDTGEVTTEQAPQNNATRSIDPATVTDFNNLYTVAEGWTALTSSTLPQTIVKEGVSHGSKKYSFSIGTLPKQDSTPLPDRPFVTDSIYALPTVTNKTSDMNRYTYITSGSAINERSSFYYLVGSDNKFVGIGGGTTPSVQYYYRTLNGVPEIAKVFTGNTVKVNNVNYKIQVTESVKISNYGQIVHTVSYMNKGTTTMPSMLYGVVLDTYLNGIDSVKMYPDGSNGVYMSINGTTLYADPIMNTKVYAAKGSNMSAYATANYYTTTDIYRNQNYFFDATGLNKGGDALNDVADTQILYEVPTKVALAPNQAVTFSFAEQILTGTDVPPAITNATVNFVDITDNLHTIPSQKISGEVGKAPTTNVITIPENYELVTPVDSSNVTYNSTTGAVTYTGLLKTDATDDATIKLKHKTKSFDHTTPQAELDKYKVTPLSKKLTRTINFLDKADESVLESPVTQTRTAVKTAAVDLVTNAITYTDWALLPNEKPTPETITIPEIMGYSTETTVIPELGLNSDPVFNVYYEEIILELDLPITGHHSKVLALAIAPIVSLAAIVFFIVRRRKINDKKIEDLKK